MFCKLICGDGANNNYYSQTLYHDHFGGELWQGKHIFFFLWISKVLVLCFICENIENMHMREDLQNFTQKEKKSEDLQKF